MTDDAAAEEAPELDARPSWARFHRRLLARMLLMGPLVVLMAVIAMWPSVGLALVLIGGGMVLGGLALAVYFARTRVRVGAREIRVRGPLRTRRWALRDIGTIVFVPPLGAPAGTEIARMATLYAVAPSLERMFSLSAGLWEADDLEAIAERIGAPVVRAPAGIPPAELRARYPGTVGALATRPWLVMLLLAAGTVFAMVIALVIAMIVLYATGQSSLPPSG